MIIHLKMYANIYITVWEIPGTMGLFQTVWGLNHVDEVFVRIGVNVFESMILFCFCRCGNGRKWERKDGFARARLYALRQALDMHASSARQEDMHASSARQEDMHASSARQEDFRVMRVMIGVTPSWQGSRVHTRSVHSRTIAPQR